VNGVLVELVAQTLMIPTLGLFCCLLSSNTISSPPLSSVVNLPKLIDPGVGVDSNVVGIRVEIDIDVVGVGIGVVVVGVRAENRGVGVGVGVVVVPRSSKIPPALPLLLRGVGVGVVESKSKMFPAVLAPPRTVEYGKVCFGCDVEKIVSNRFKSEGFDPDVDWLESLVELFSCGCVLALATGLA